MLGLLFSETSAKAPTNVEKPFITLAAEVIKNKDINGKQNNSRLTIEMTDATKTWKCC